jgi:predicted HicB family RNase H-like nuclease
MVFKYKGYLGRINDFDLKSELFHGKVIGLAKDVITFQGRNRAEINQAFKDSVEDYLVWCKELGEKAEKTYSRKIMITNIKLALSIIFVFLDYGNM